MRAVLNAVLLYHVQGRKSMPTLCPLGLCQSQLPRTANGVDARFRGHDKALLGVVTPAKSMPSCKRGRGSMSFIRSHRTLTEPYCVHQGECI